MVGVHRRHPNLSVLNIEAAASGLMRGAKMVLSPPIAGGQLAAVLQAEHFQTVDLPQIWVEL
jgi:hypothetical protein